MNIHSLFEPKSIAVIGASTEIGSVGNDVVKNLVEQKFAGAVYPVNPKAENLHGLRCYPNIASIDADVECAVIIVPARIVPVVLREAIAKGVQGVVVISAGFREAGNAELEEEIMELAREADIALLGPNCLGIVNPHQSMNASFAKTLPEKGNVAFLSQSGALGTAILDMAHEFGIGISKLVSLGNKACIDESALLEYLMHDRRTAVIALYAEDLRHPHDIIRTVRAMALQKISKPVIVLKSGKTSVGASASSSHTGSLAGRDASYGALFEEAGILRAETAEELFLFARAFSLSPLPAGKNIAIVTNAGGPGVLATDAAVENNLSLAPISPSTQESLRAFLPSSASVKNPIDILGDARSDRYAQALNVILRDASVDIALVVLTPQSMTDTDAIASEIATISKEIRKPVVAVFMGGKLVEHGRRILRKNKIPVASFPESGIRMLSALASFAQFQKSVQLEEEVSYTFATLCAPDMIDRERVRSILDQVKSEHRVNLSQIEALDIFSAYGFPIPKYARAASKEEADRAGQTINMPLAVKILSDDILHKSDAGGVLLNTDPQRAGESCEKVMERVRRFAPEARLDGVLLMEMAPKGGRELILGSFTDSSLGQTLMIGSGGIYVEILKDASFGLVPITHHRAEKMLHSLRIFPMLNGARGGEAYAVDAVIECIGRLSHLLSDFPEIRELDLNPIFVYPKGSGKSVVIADGRIAL